MRPAKIISNPNKRSRSAHLYTNLIAALPFVGRGVLPANPVIICDDAIPADACAANSIFGFLCDVGVLCG
jgi:hypothetical protein